MPIKNYTTTVKADKSIMEIQTALVKHGAVGMFYEFDKEGRIEALKFGLDFQGKKIGFALPVNWRKFQKCLQDQGIRNVDAERAYKVAWRNIRDWVLAQLALYETEMVDLPQVFLPFATDEKGKTLYDKVVENQFLLPSGQ